MAVIANAGFESVNAGDLPLPPLIPASLDSATTARLHAVLEAEGLGGLVASRLPLDLTPMASEDGYRKAVDVLMGTSATIVILGLVPFTRRLHTGWDDARRYAQTLAATAHSHGVPSGGVVDAGSDYGPYRQAFASSGLPVFTRMEDAIAGLRALG